jgi:hypothetical protein
LVLFAALVSLDFSRKKPGLTLAIQPDAFGSGATANVTGAF